MGDHKGPESNTATVTHISEYSLRSNGLYKIESSNLEALNSAIAKLFDKYPAAGYGSMIEDIKIIDGKFSTYFKHWGAD